MAATGVWRQLPAFPVTADGAAGDVPWPKVQRRIAQLIQRDEFFTEQEQDNFENIDPVEIRERLAERGIVDGKVVDPEKTGQRPLLFVRSWLMWSGPLVQMRWRPIPPRAAIPTGQGTL